MFRHGFTFQPNHCQGITEWLIHPRGTLRSISSDQRTHLQVQECSHGQKEQLFPLYPEHF